MDVASRAADGFACAFRRIEEELPGTKANSLRARKVANILRGVEKG